MKSPNVIVTPRENHLWLFGALLSTLDNQRVIIPKSRGLLYEKYGQLLGKKFTAL